MNIIYRIITNHRQERDSVREENQQMCQQLKVLREELVNADLNLEKIRQKSVETNLQNQEILASEKRRRLETEEDMKLHSEASHIFFPLHVFALQIFCTLKLST